MTQKKVNNIQEQINRILFISNYNLNNPPKIVKENYYNEEEIDYENIEKENEKGYPANYQYVDEYQNIDEQPAPTKKKEEPKPEIEAPKLAPTPGAGTPELGGPPSPEPTGEAPGEQTPPVDITPPITPEPSPEKEKKPEVPSATKSDVKDVEKGVESVGDYSKKVMTQQAEILTKVDDMMNKLGNVDQLSQKVDQISHGLKEIKPQSYRDKLEMISLNSGPFNVKLSDYWGDLDGQEQQEPQQKEYKLDKQDIANFDAREIKDSLFSTGDGEENDESIRKQRSMGY